jgi:CRISPR-associated protein Cas1
VALEYGILRVEDRCLFLDREDGSGIEIPVGMVSALLLEPGVSVTHEAVKLAAEHDVILLWVGEAGVRFYSAGMPGGKSGRRLVAQALQHANPELRMQAARRMYQLMFDEEMRETRSLDKLRGIEGAKVKAWYAAIATAHGVEWKGREGSSEALKVAMGIATSCLYGVCEAIILTAGFSPAIGIIHSGNPRSLVFDLADTVKFRTVIPVAFKVFVESHDNTMSRARWACRDMFRETGIVDLLFDNLYEMLGSDVVGSPSE